MSRDSLRRSAPKIMGRIALTYRLDSWPSASAVQTPLSFSDEKRESWKREISRIQHFNLGHPRGDTRREQPPRATYPKIYLYDVVPFVFFLVGGRHGKNREAVISIRYACKVGEPRSRTASVLSCSCGDSSRWTSGSPSRCELHPVSPCTKKSTSTI